MLNVLFMNVFDMSILKHPVQQNPKKTSLKTTYCDCMLLGIQLARTNSQLARGVSCWLCNNVHTQSCLKSNMDCLKCPKDLSAEWCHEPCRRNEVLCQMQQQLPGSTRWIMSGQGTHDG